MLFEQPLSFATTGMALAMMIPECKALPEQPHLVPGPALIAGTLIGGIGVYLGSATAINCSRRLERALRLPVWGLLGLAMTVCTAYFVFRPPAGWQKLFFIGFSCAPLVAYLAVLLQKWRGAKRRAIFHE